MKRISLFAGLAIVTGLVGSARADYSFDDDTGFAQDTLTSNVFILTQAGTTLLGGAVRLDATSTGNPDETGSFTTKAIEPASFSSFNRVYFKASGTPRQGQTAQQIIEVEALSVDALGNAGSVIGSGALPWITSDDPAYTGMADISAITQAAHGAIILRFTLHEAAINPAIDQWKVTWFPHSELSISYSAPATVCSGASLKHQIRVAVSHVRATNVLVTMPLATGQTVVPDGQSSAAFIEATRLSLQSSVPSAGSTGASPITLASGQVVPAYTAYFFLGDVDPGHTFQLLLTTTAPNGTLSNTAYNIAATAQAGNADTKVTSTTTTTIANTPARSIIKRTFKGVYRINQLDYASPSVAPAANVKLGFDVTVEVPYQGQCAENYYNLAVWDQLDFLTNQGKVPFVKSGADVVVEEIADTGGTYTSGGANVFGTGPQADTLAIPAKSVYWTIPRIDNGQSRTLRFTVTLNDTSVFPFVDDSQVRDYFTNTARMNSGFHPQSALREASTKVYLYPPQTPVGIYRKGDNIHGSSSASAVSNDNAYSAVTYGEDIGWLLAIDNTGFSDLVGHFFFDKLPTQVQLQSVSAPTGATVYYATDTTATNPATPPGFTRANFNPPAQSNPLAALDGAVWTNAASYSGSLDAVTWVAVYVPSVGSILRQGEAGVTPYSAVAEIKTRVRNPTSNCSEFTITNVGDFQTLGYRTTAGQLKVTGLAATDAEPVQVRPITPSYELIGEYANPNVRVGPGTVTYNVDIPNRRLSGDQVDTALDVVATITFPKVSVNGVQIYLPITAVSGGAGATIDNSQIGSGKVKVSWGSQAPGETKRITVTIQVPKGLSDGATINASTSVTAQDDVCGAVNGGTAAVASVIVKPHLKGVVQSRYEVVAAGGGQVNDYTETYANIGDAMATGSLLADRVPTNMLFDTVLAPVGVKIYFSNKTAPAVPAWESDWNLTAAQVAAQPANFTLATSPTFDPVTGMNIWSSPYGGNTTWVVALTDVTNLSPAGLPTFSASVASKIVVRASVAAGVPEGTVITNRAVIAGDDLIPSITNQVRLVVSARSGLEVTRTCGPDVAAGGEPIHLSSHYVNNSTNQDQSASFSETLPAEAVIDHVTVAVFDESGAPVGTPFDATPAQFAAHGITFNAGILSFAYPNFNFLYRLELDLYVHLDDVETGESFFFSNQGVADNDTPGTDPTYATGSCAILVANPDLVSTKLVDIARPVNGDIVTFTVTVSNVGSHRAANVELVDDFDPRFAFVNGSVIVLTPGWTFDSNSNPAQVGGNLVWSASHDNALVRVDGDSDFPGNSGDVTFIYQAQVLEQLPNRDIENCIEPRQGAGGFTEDSEVANDEFANNESCVTVHTPYPDLFVSKSGPLDAVGGAEVSWTLTYGNHSRQAATQGFLADALPDWGGDGAPPQSPGLADGKADVIVTGVQTRYGETVYYSDAPLGGSAPSFPSGQWSTTSSGHSNWIGILADTVPAAGAPGQPASRAVTVRARLRNPRNQVLPKPGTAYTNCVSIGSATNDDEPADNGPACATTTIPGVDLAVDKSCGGECATGSESTCIDPTVRLRPGDTVKVVLAATNSGTENVFAIRVSDSFPAQLVPQSAALQALVSTTSGGSAYLIDPAGHIITDSVSWTAVSGGWILGANGAGGGARDYQTVGLAPGTQARFVVTAQVRGDVQSGGVLSNTAVVSMEQVGARPEEYLVNNTDACSIEVYRPDVRTEKSVSDENGGTGPVGANSNLSYTIGYNNVGKADANGVRLTDDVPNGTYLIPSSFTDLPAGSEIVFFDADGAVVTNPAQGGLADPRIASFEIRLEDPTPAPLGDVFFESDNFAGTFAGTAEFDGSVVAVGGNPEPTYTTPEVPVTSGDIITGWLLVTINGKTQVVVGGPNEAPGAELPPFLVTVLDADNNPIAGYVNLPVDASGSVDISGISAVDHPKLHVRVTLPPGSAADSLTPVHFDALGQPTAPGEVWLQDGKWAYGIVGGQDSNGGEKGRSSGDQSPVLAAWHKEGSEWILDLPDPQNDIAGWPSQIIWGGQGAFLAYSNNGTYWIWRKVGTEWQSHILYEADGNLATNGYIRDATTCIGSSCVELCGFDGCPSALWFSWNYFGQLRSGVFHYDAGGDRYSVAPLPAPNVPEWQPYQGIYFYVWAYEVNARGSVWGQAQVYNGFGWYYYWVFWTWDGTAMREAFTRPQDNDGFVALTQDDEVVGYHQEYMPAEGRWSYEPAVWSNESGSWQQTVVTTDDHYAYVTDTKQFRPDVPAYALQIYHYYSGYNTRGVLAKGPSGWVAQDLGPAYGNNTQLTDVGYRLGLGTAPVFNDKPTGFDIFGSDTRPLTDTNAITRYILSGTAAWGESLENNDTNGSNGTVPAPAFGPDSNDTNSTPYVLWMGGPYGADGGAWIESNATGWDDNGSVALWFAPGGNEQYGVTGNVGDSPGDWESNRAAVWQLENRLGNGFLPGEPLPAGEAPDAEAYAQGGQQGVAFFGSSSNASGNTLNTVWNYGPDGYVPSELPNCPQQTQFRGVTPAGVPFGSCRSGGQQDPIIWRADGLGEYQIETLPLSVGSAQVDGYDQALDGIVGRSDYYYDPTYNDYWYYVPVIWYAAGGGFENAELKPQNVAPELQASDFYRYGSTRAFDRVGNRISSWVYTNGGQQLPVIWENNSGQWTPTLLDHGVTVGGNNNGIYLSERGDAVFYSNGVGSMLYRDAGSGSWTPIGLVPVGEEQLDHWFVVNVIGRGATNVPATTTRVLLNDPYTARYAVAEVDDGGSLSFFVLDDVSYIEAVGGIDFTFDTIRAGYIYGAARNDEIGDEPAVWTRTDTGYVTTRLTPTGYDSIEPRYRLGANVLYGYGYRTADGDGPRLLVFRNEPDGSENWLVDDVTPEGYWSTGDDYLLAHALSARGVGVSWFENANNGELALFAIVPDAGGTSLVGGSGSGNPNGAPDDAPSIAMTNGYAPQALGIDGSYDEYAEAGVFISGECWILDDGNYFWNCGNSANSAKVDDITVSYVAGDPEFTYQTQVRNTCLATIDNTVLISTETPEITTANNSGFASIAVKHADLSVTLTTNVGVAGIGEPVSYTATVHNNGPDAAEAVQLEFTYPDEVLAYSSNIVDIGILGPNEDYEISFDGEVATEDNGVSLVGSAIVADTSTEDFATDCNVANDAASATIISGNFPNVWVTKDCPTSVAKGSVVTCLITYGNNGNAEAANVSVTDTYPAGVDIASSQHGEGVSESDDAHFDVGTLQPGFSDSILVSYLVDDCDLVGLTLTNNVHIESNPPFFPPEAEQPNQGPDANAFDNDASDSTLVLQSLARIDIRVFASRPAVELDEYVTFTAEFSANGAEDVVDPVVVMQVPANATLATWTPGGVVSGSTITWQVGAPDGTSRRLLAGQSGTVAFTVKASQANTTLVGSAEVSGQNVCPVDPADAVDVLVDGPGVHITKASSAHVVCSDDGETLRWSIFVSNTGPTPAANVVVTDAIPAGVALVGGSLSGRGASSAGLPLVRWDVGTLAPGEGLELSFATSVPTSDGSLVTNVAQLTYLAGTETVTLRSNEVPVRVACDDTLTLSKSWDAGCNRPNDTIHVSIHWANQSNVPVASLVIRDEVGAFADVASADGGVLVGGLMTWTLTNVAPGQSGTVTWSGRPDAGASGDVLTDVAVAVADGLPQQVSNAVGTVLVVCAVDPDGNPCTSDACEPGLGCYNAPTAAPGTVCSDNNPCTDGDACVAGACVGATPKVCDDDNLCTSDSCDPTTVQGCVFRDVGATLCDDAIACTSDSCDASLGCVNAPHDEQCTDDSRCTRDFCDVNAEPGTSGCAVEILPEPPGGGDVSCGEGVCAGFTGEVTCEADGSESSTCDPAYAAIIDHETCDDEKVVVYAIVEDNRGEPAGTIRCTHTVTGGVIACDPSEDPTDDPRTLQVYPDLMCPGFAPTAP